MKICALRLSKNFVFPTICVLTLQNTDVRKFPCGNFLPLKVRKPRYTPPVFVHLLRKRFFMRAAARLPFLHENILYRQTDPAFSKKAGFFMSVLCFCAFAVLFALCIGLERVDNDRQTEHDQ